MFVSEEARKRLHHGFMDSGQGYLKVHLGYAPGKPRRRFPKYEFCHRLLLYFIFGPPNAIGLWECCHICNNKSCLNPFHLVWGTKKDNKANSMPRYIELAREQGHPEDTIPSYVC